MRWYLVARGNSSTPIAGAAAATRLHEVHLKFAWQRGEPVPWIDLRLNWDGFPAGPPRLGLELHTGAATLDILNDRLPGDTLVRLHLPTSDTEADGKVVCFIEGMANAQVPRCRIEVRRSRCQIDTALLGSGGDEPALSATLTSALLWHADDRWTKLIGLKEFRTGFGGSRVFVFQPLLRGVRCGDSTLPPARGSPLLVKVGNAQKLEQEWRNFDEYLAGHNHPFLARSEAFLHIHAAEATSHDRGSTPSCDDAVLISSFLGGDLLQLEPLEMFIRTAEEDECLERIDRLFDLLASLYHSSRAVPLSNWRRIFDTQARTLRKTAVDRLEPLKECFSGIAWDLSFASNVKRLFKADGLLARVMQTTPVRFSLIHGDLHLQNALVGGDNVWLIDFATTGLGPTLFDFAKLEIGIRLWCLPLVGEAPEFESGVVEFEKLLFDLMFGSESSLSPTHALAVKLGVSAELLHRLTACIQRIRCRALPYCLGGPDRRDYLAVLLLTVVDTLRYAGSDVGREPRLRANYTLLLALYWQLEAVLSRMVGLEPFAERRLPLDRKFLVTAPWLLTPGAAARVAYFLERDDGRRALPFVAGMRHVMQNPFHHLDCLDHALLVLVDLEVLLDKPWESLTCPREYEHRVGETLKAQGFERWLALRCRAPEQSCPDLTDIEPYREDIEKLLKTTLTDEARLLLKWTALLHDVGKPATRLMSPKGNRVQCLMHEQYGASLIGDFLKHLFPDAAEARAHCLIRHHERPLHILDRPSRKNTLANLKRTLRTGLDHKGACKCFMKPYMHPPAEEAEPWREVGGPITYSILLMMHAYADRAACCGIESTDCLAELAEFILVSLALLARRGWLVQRQADIEQKKNVIIQHARLRCSSGPRLGELVRKASVWFENTIETTGHVPDEQDIRNHFHREVDGHDERKTG